MKVFCYWNLHRNLFSVRALTGPSKGLVIAHSQVVKLIDVEPRVSEAGRQRVLRDRSKNVHAGLAGTLVQGKLPAPLREFSRVRYNPYEAGAFFVLDEDGRTAGELVRAPAARLSVAEGRPHVVVFDPVIRQLLQEAA